MKAKIRKTGEIVTVVSYSSSMTRMREFDYVNYIDKDGNEIYGKGLNWMWDIEFLDNDSKVTTDWQSLRIEAAMRAMQSIISKLPVSLSESIRATTDTSYEDTIAQKAVKLADALIEKLKKEKDN